jgi:hypothetical protein
MECETRVGNFRQRNYSAGDGIGGTIGLFRRNSSCYTERKTFGIPFRTISRKRKMLGILYRGTKIEAKLSEFRSEIPNHAAVEKTTRNSVPRNSEYPRNVHFLPRNNGVRSESIPRNFPYRCSQYAFLCLLYAQKTLKDSVMDFQFRLFSLSSPVPHSSIDTI